MKIQFVCWLLLLGTCFLPARNITVTQGLSDLQFDKNVSGQSAMNHLYVVTLINPQLTYSVQSTRALAKLPKMPAGQNLSVYCVIPQQLTAVQAFAAAHKDLPVNFCADNEFTETRKLLGKNFHPAHIFDRSGKLLWSGDTIDLPMMLQIIGDKKYSERNEIRISALTNSLQAALRSGNAKLIEESANRILTLRPRQLSAVHAKAYALEISGRIDDLVKFYRERIKRDPSAPENYFMLLEAAFRIPQLQSLAPAIAREFIQACPGELENINAVAWSLLNNQPLNIQAFTAAEAAVKLLSQAPESRQTSRILATRALLAYRKCDLKSAIELSGQALQKATSPAEKALLDDLLKYFKQIGK